MSFERGCCLNKDVCLGLSTESEVEAQHVVWVWWNALHSFTVSPISSAPLYSSLQFDLDQPSSRHPLLCCAMPCLFPLRVLTRAHILRLFYSIQGSIKDAHFTWYHHLWFPPTMVSLLAIWFSLPSLFSIFPASYLWKWQCYLQSLSSGFADRENGGGDRIWLGHGLWRMIQCACTWLHLQNLICSQCRESQRQASESGGGGEMQRMGQRCGIEKKWWTEKMEEKERQRMTPDGDRREIRQTERDGDELC